VQNEPGVREWWVAQSDPEFLQIETMRDRPERVVVQVPDRAELAAAINGRFGGG
jgi:hypothetical protein